MEILKTNPRLSNLRPDYQEFVMGIFDRNVDSTVDDKTFLQRACLRALLIYYSEHDRRPLATDAIHIAFDGEISILDIQNTEARKLGLTIPFTVKTIFDNLPSGSNLDTDFIAGPLIGLSWYILKHVLYSLNAEAVDDLCKEYRYAVTNPGVNPADFGRYLTRLAVELNSALVVTDEVLDNDRSEAFKSVTNKMRYGCIINLAILCVAMIIIYTILANAVS